MRREIPTKQVRAGDTIVAVSSAPLNTPIPVIEVVGTDGNISVHIRTTPSESGVSPDRYLISKTITVERKRRKVTRTFEGIKFINQEDGSWVTEDGKYSVTYEDDFETECDNPHPVRISAATRAAFWADSQWDRDHHRRWDPHDFRWALKSNRRGYLCPGNATHFYGLWVAGSTDSADVINREETFTESATHLALWIQGKADWRG